MLARIGAARVLSEILKRILTHTHTAPRAHAHVTILSEFSVCVSMCLTVLYLDSSSYPLKCLCGDRDRMDKFLVKGAFHHRLGKGEERSLREEQDQTGEDAAVLRGEEGSSRKRPRRDTAEDGVHSAGPRWRHIRAQDLDCDYTVLFGRAEADEIFQQLEKEVEYFTGLTLSPKPWIPVLERVRDRVSQLTGHTFNFVLVNRYKDGRDHIGEHRDDERELDPRIPIASVSFGACRDFFFRHKDSRGKRPSQRVDMVRLQLAHGSLLLMKPPTNTHWYHSLPVRKKILAPRVNLTFRKILPTKK
ncbi:DNA oxidative demethylase ALKBH2 isoform X2 [Loxodonta africana]|uniref:DNA oxidative demethylase ALKBH2 isoform X2 n=1 Tax=Loxodonta africana TaxID=9785 RepID=UPI0030D39F99